MAGFEVGGLITLQRDRFGFSCRGWPWCQADGVAARMSWLKAGRIERERWNSWPRRKKGMEEVQFRFKWNRCCQECLGCFAPTGCSIFVFYFCSWGGLKVSRSYLHESEKDGIHFASCHYFLVCAHVNVTECLSLEQNENDCVTYRKNNL